MIALEVLMVDYLNITTFHDYTEEWIMESIYGVLEGERKSQRRGSYNGYTLGEHCFIGETKQKRKETGNYERNVMFTISGASADKVYRELHRVRSNIRDYGPMLRCTRIDLQKTYTEGFIVNLLGKTIEEIALIVVNSTSGRWPSDMPHRAWHENCTLYLGKREDDIFRRLYLKETTERLYRFETEFKGKKAQDVFIESIHCLSRFVQSWMNMPMFDMRFLGRVNGYVRWSPEKSKMQTRQHWLQQTVASAIMKDTENKTLEGFDLQALTSRYLEGIQWVYDLLVKEELDREQQETAALIEKVSRETFYDVGQNDETVDIPLEESV